MSQRFQKFKIFNQRYGQQASSFFVLFLCLLISSLLSIYSAQLIENDEDTRFKRVTSNIIQSLVTRIQIHENALMAVRGLFMSSEMVSHQEFLNFLKGINLENRFPGLIEVGYIAHLEIAGERTLPVIYYNSGPAEKWETYRADMSKSPWVKKTIDQAVLTGRPQVSRKIEFEEIEDSSEFLIFVPVYKKNIDIEKTENRYQVLEGLVYGRFQVNQFFKNISGELQKKNPRMAMEIYDISPSEGHLLYKSIQLPYNKNLDEARSISVPVKIAEDQWIASLTSLPGFKIRSAKKIPLYLFTLGSIISFLIFYILRVGDKLTSKLRDELILKEKSEEEIKMARRVAEEANRAKSDFLANISHEIRTPLGVIAGFTDLALQRSQNKGEIYGYLKTIERNSKQLGLLIGEVLDMSKIEANKLEVEKVQFSLRALIEEVISSSQLKAQKKGIELISSINEPFPDHFESDPTKIRQILNNLIGNAIKFTEYGKVQLTSSALSEIQNDVEVGIEFTVEDSGVGMTLKQQKKIFCPFEQADSSTTRKYGGTGLGLFISKQMAKALGGDVKLRWSRIGHGSCFIAKIKGKPFCIKASGVKDLTGSKSRTEKKLDGTKVLVAEDSKDIQSLLKLYLEDAGAQVDMANDGLEAIDKVEHHSYDVVLMDIQMPRLDGHHATARLRESGYKKPIIALTAHAFTDERDRALSGGFNRYLIKPISKRNLIEGIHQVTHLDV